MLKQTKVSGTMTGIARIGNLVSLMATTTTTRNLYTVECVRSDQYTVTKFEKLEAVATYAVDSWKRTCECKGFKRGSLCRHLKMVAALEKQGIV